MKIVNRKKFVRSIGIMMIILIGILIILMNNTYSKGEIQYLNESINIGDTVWSIAEKQIEKNEYYRGKDIRAVVYDIKKINHLENVNLQEGQKILIPTYEKVT